MNETVFGKIIKGEIPATRVHEDNQCLAFMDINPVSLGHVLLISKEPYVWMQDVPDELLSYLFITAKKLIQAIKDGTGCDYVQLSVIGKDIPHFHIHLIPRYFNDELRGWPTHEYGNGEMQIFAEKIKEKIK